MVTQAEAPSSSPPRPGTRNSLTTAAAIRRGAIKISNPIPFPEEDGVRAPASVPGAPAAQIAPSADVTGEKAITLADIRPPQSSQFNGSYDGRPPTRARRVVPNANGGVTTEAQSGDSPSQHSRAGKSVEVLPTQPPLNPRHQQNRSSLRNPRNSGVMSGTSQRGSSYEASGDDDSKESSGKKRSSGTLRNVLRKMFGSKREKDDRRAPSRKGSKTREIGDWMMDDNEHDAVTRSNTTHNGKQFTSDRDAPIDPMKLPVHEITPRTALGSHLPFPMNVNAPQPSPPNRAFGEQAFEPLDAVSKVPRRRATLPSLILSPSEAATLNAMWDKEIESGAIGEELKKGRTPTPDIGRAITSAGGQAYKRRSRSADALNDLAREQQTIEQQTRAEEAGGNGRKAEIEYWRASLGAGVQTHDFQRQQEPLDRDKSPGSSSGSGRSMKTANLAQSGDEKGQPEMDEDDDDSILLHRRTPPNERASFEKPSPEDVRPPHPFERPTVQTQPATALYSHSRNFSRPVADSGEVEKLRENVEDRLSRLEFTVHKLENSNNRRTIILENAPQGRRSKAEDNSSSNESNHSRSQRLRHASNVQPALDFIQRNQDRSPSIADASSPMTPTVPANSQPMYNMYSGSTFSPNSSASHHPYQQQAPVPAVGSYNFAGSNSNVVPSSLPSPNIYDHLAPLYRALRYERSKRKEFATQLQSVHQQMAELNTMIRGSSSQQFDQTRANGYKEVHARGGPSNSYPTPSPNDAFRSSGSIPSNIAAEDGMGWKGQQSRFSGLEYDSSEDEYNHPYSRRHGRSRGAREYDAESGAEKEIYGTPKETMVSLQQSIEQTLPPAPPTPHAPVSSKIPTPKQSMKNLVQKQPSFSNSPVGTSSSSTVGTSKSSGSRRNRFGFKGGKG